MSYSIELIPFVPRFNEKKRTVYLWNVERLEWLKRHIATEPDFDVNGYFEHVNYEDDVTRLEAYSGDGNVEVVKFLLGFEGVEVRSSLYWTVTNGEEEVVELLLEDERIRRSDLCSDALRIGYSDTEDEEVRDCIEIMLLKLDLPRKLVECARKSPTKGIAEDLLKKYLNNPVVCRLELFEKWFPFSLAELFALVTLCSEGFLQAKEKTPRKRRFIHIAVKLPTELQMILCNRAMGSMKTFIPSVTPLLLMFLSNLDDTSLFPKFVPEEKINF